MQISKKDLKLLISCTMLIIFLIKIASPVNRFFKTHKSSSLVNNISEEQTDADKKDESKPGSNFNESTDFLTEKVSENLYYQTVFKSYSKHQIGFLANHFPTVITPPPNC